MMSRRADGSVDYGAREIEEELMRRGTWNSLGGWWVTFGFLAVMLALVIEFAPVFPPTFMTAIGLMSYEDCVNDYYVRKKHTKHLCVDGTIGKTADGELSGSNR